MASQPTNSRYPDYIVVKFKDSVKLPYSDSFVQNEANLDRAGLSPLNQLFHEFEGTIMQRLFNSVPPEEVASLEETATREPAFTGETGVSPHHSNILSYFRIIPPPNINAESIIERLRQLDFVEEAYIEGKPTPPPFVNQSDDPLAKFQAYEASAPQGIDSHFAWTLRGGDGESLQFVDLEQGWTLNHEDLAAKGITIISGVNNRFFAHGTNVLGEIVGVDNNVGIVGIGPNLDSVQVVSQWRTASNFSTADAILSATNQLVKEAKQRKKAGSVLLLEAQTTVTHTMPGVHLPVEVEPAVFDAIKLATNSGIIVVEAAGNGLNNGGPGADLDQFVSTTGKRVLNRNSPDFKDSGAIIVAAASSGVPHSRMSFSNFGSRIDCYAWGENVTTTGSSKAPGSPTAYTHTFSGTSSASPIIAGAALALQGISEAYLGTSFSPLNMRSMLSVVATGTTSANPSVEKIGVMPDLKKIVTVSMGLTPAAILAKDLAALVTELLGSGLIPRPLCHTFSKAMPVLKAGSKGPQVEFLQRALAHIKHSPGAFDGVFGEQTKAAVHRFQASQGLAQDGIVGTNTWDTICTSLSSTPSAIVLCPAFSKAMPVLKAGSKGPQVEFLQRALAHIKHSPGAFDGVFGEQTKAAVNRFQTSVQLSSDGIAGPNTWGALCTSFSNIKKKVIVTLGSRGGELRVLQHFLSKQGFGPGLIDGIFGDSIRNAVMQFQKSSGLIPNGIVESATWAKLLQSKLLLGSQQQESIVTQAGVRGALALGRAWIYDKKVIYNENWRETLTGRIISALRRVGMDINARVTAVMNTLPKGYQAYIYDLSGSIIKGGAINEGVILRGGVGEGLREIFILPNGITIIKGLDITTGIMNTIAAVYPGVQERVGAAGGGKLELAFAESMPSNLPKLSAVPTSASSVAPIPKTRSPFRIGRRYRFNTMKEAREAAERASPFRKAVKHTDGPGGPHFHPADNNGRPLNHDHYYFPRRFL
jgi:peptidoglycan hydrolase-like protein with peptidoglycan-binding domain